MFNITLEILESLLSKKHKYLLHVYVRYFNKIILFAIFNISKLQKQTYNDKDKVF